MAATTVPALSTADRADAAHEHGQPARAWPGRWLHFGGRLQFWGTVRTVCVRQDVALLRRLLEEEPGAGHMLVVDAGGHCDEAVFGDRLATLALAHGWAGVVVFGAVRDVRALAGIDLGVLALGSVPVRVRGTLPGMAGERLNCGGVAVVPGMRLHADQDGVLLMAGD